MQRKVLGAAVTAAMVSVLGFATQSSNAAIVYSAAGTTVTQNFDSLPASGSPAWANDSTLAGWSLFAQPAPGTPIAAIAAGDGSSNAGSFYSFGTAGNGERALGGVGSGGAYFGSPASAAVAGWMAVAVTNGTGAAIGSFTVQYDGEQWRNGGNTSAQPMALQYGFGSTFGTVGTWITPGGSFDFISPTVGSTAGALNGNAAANRVADLGGTISGLNWAAGDTLWVRWVEVNDAGNDHGLAVDNFRFSATNVPEPATFGLAALGALSTIARRRTRSQ